MGGFAYEENGHYIAGTVPAFVPHVADTATVTPAGMALPPVRKAETGSLLRYRHAHSPRMRPFRQWKGSVRNAAENVGARDRNRTGTPFLARDFKSLVSTNFTTRATVRHCNRSSDCYKRLFPYPFVSRKTLFSVISIVFFSLCEKTIPSVASKNVTKCNRCRLYYSKV